MATKKQTKESAQQQVKQRSVARRQVAKLNAEASEKRIAQMAAKELKKMTFAAEQQEAKRRAEVQFAEIAAQAKGVNQKGKRK